MRSCKSARVCVCVCAGEKRQADRERGKPAWVPFNSVNVLLRSRVKQGLDTSDQRARSRKKKRTQLGAVHLPFLWHVKTGGFALYIQRANTTRATLNMVPGRHTHSRTHKQLETFCKVGKSWVWGRDKRPKENSHQRTNEEKKDLLIVISWCLIGLVFVCYFKGQSETTTSLLKKNNNFNLSMNTFYLSFA